MKNIKIIFTFLLFIFIFISSIAFARGTVEEKTMYSQTLGRDIKYKVYLPKDYNNGENFNVFFLLHGLYGNEKDWTDPQQGSASVIFDELIYETEAIEPMVVIMPDGGNTWYIDSKEKIQTAYEKDLFPFVFTNYKVSKERDKVIIGGLSMGGMGSLNFFLRNPEIFGRVILLSPAVYDKLTDEFLEVSTVTQKDMFNSYWTNNLENYKNKNYANELKSEIYIVIGDDDNLVNSEGKEDFQERTVSIYRELKNLGNNVELRIVNGGHIWKVWRDGLRQGLITTDKNLKIRNGFSTVD